MKLLTVLVVCISDDYELGTQNSLPFAGFFSCKSGNPLALKERSDPLKSTGHSSMLTNFMRESGPQSYPAACPESYSQHLALVDKDCSIHYCIKTGAITASGLPPIKQPPFMNAPKGGLSEDQEHSVVVNEAGDVWTSLEKANTMIPQNLKQSGIQMTMEVIIRKSDSSSSTKLSASSELSGGYIALISVLHCRDVTDLHSHPTPPDAEPGICEEMAVQSRQQRVTWATRRSKPQQ
ncbi:hypothetical protein DPMN_128359 [Dreissena polymorpha]|uniref:Uncharacterized protein n=1 Tax=Dreissena polymorpha TaxID=45954 RepID=A0A9D4H2Y7_DREPO|nr:hypothetical protein DPMN_128359 [Dreissena polymorpha]